MGCLLICLFCLWVSAPPLAAQEKTPVQPPPAALPLPSPEALRDYVIGPQDLLLISILESPELSREVRVSADGTIGLPLLPMRLRLQGLMLSEAEDFLEKQYREAGILNQPNITITVKDLQSKPVTVMGAVHNPGVFQVAGQTRLLRVITQAGGLTDEAGNLIQVIRAGTASPEQVLEVPVEELRRGALEVNLPIYGGDTINVVPAGAVYVVGAVNRPGRYLLRGDTDQHTVLHLLALVEDFKRTAKPEKSWIIRRNPASKALDQIHVNIKKIMQRKGPDVSLLPNDVLFVPDSTSKRAMARGLEAAMQVAMAVAIIGVR